MLIAIKSCERDARNGANQAIRDTWGKNRVIFFLGRTTVVPKDDEIELDCPDDYDSLPLKTREIAKLASKKNFSHIFLCDTDSFVILDRLYSCGFEQYDYMGLFGEGYNGDGHFDHKISGPWDRKAPDMMMRDVYPWASGGHGYFLSLAAARMVAAIEPTHWAEDFCVGQILGPAIEAGLLTSYNHPRFNGYVVDHFSTTGQNKTYDPQWMHERFREGLA